MITIIRLTIFLFISVYTTALLAASTITVTNGDRANFGFNDMTAITPAGGNNARTLGQARLNAVQYTANKLSIRLNSNVEIDIIASFTSFGGDGRGAILAGAFAPSYVQNFSGALQANTLYHVAIVEKLSGTNVNGNRTGEAAYEVSIDINADVDGNVALGSRKWYYGFDARPRNGDVDFVTVLTHEIIHGLGFSTQMRSASGIRNNLLNDNYIANLEHHGAAPANYSAMRFDSQRAAGNVSDRNLHWIGPVLVAAANNNVGFQTPRHAGMFAPNPVQNGSSVSHFSRLFSNPSEMMEPAYSGANHNIGFAAQVLSDVGWGTLNSSITNTDLAVTITNVNLNPALGSNEVYSVIVVNNSAQQANGIVISNFLPANSDFVSVTAANTGTCSTSNVAFNRILTCKLPSLPASGSAVFNVTVAIKRTGSSEFGANVESLDIDSNWQNNNALNGITPVKPPVQGAPVFKTISNREVIAGQLVVLNLAATDDDGDIPIISINKTPLGSQFIANNDGTAVFSWIPSAADVGLNRLDFVAIDGNQQSSLMDTLSINVNVTAKVVQKPPLPETPTQPLGTTPTRGNTDVPTGGCTLNKTAKFDPILPLLLLLSMLFLCRHKVIRVKK